MLAPRLIVFKAVARIAKGGDLRREKGQGKMRTSTSAQNAREVERVIREEPKAKHLSFRYLAKKTGAQRTASLGIAKDHFKRESFKKGSRWMGKRDWGASRTRNLDWRTSVDIDWWSEEKIFRSNIP